MLGAQVYCAYKIPNTCKLDKVRQHRIQQKNGHATTLPAFFKLKKSLRVVSTQRITPQHNTRPNHATQQNRQNQGDCPFRTIEADG